MVLKGFSQHFLSLFVALTCCFNEWGGIWMLGILTLFAYNFFSKLQLVRQPVRRSVIDWFVGSCLLNWCKSSFDVYVPSCTVKSRVQLAFILLIEWLNGRQWYLRIEMKEERRRKNIRQQVPGKGRRVTLTSLEDFREGC